MTDNSYNPYNPQQPPQGQPGQSYGPSYGGPNGQQPQGNWPQPGYGPPAQGQPPYPQGQPQQAFPGGPPQFQQPGPPPYQQQPYGQQPYGAPPTTGASTPSKLFGWLMVLFAVIAIACCFGPWASMKVSSNVLPVSVTASVNGFDHTSCSGSAQACDDFNSDDSSSNSGSSPAGSTPGTTSDASIWEGWVIAAIGAVVIVLGVLRGLGKRALSLPAAVAAAVGGLAVIGMTGYRWSWIHDKFSDAQDQLKASGGMAKDVTYHFGTGWGLWLTLAAGVLLAVVGAGGLLKRR